MKAIMQIFEKESTFEIPADELFAWHERPGAFERLAPPWRTIRVLERQGTIRDGDTLAVETRQGPFRIRWRALHQDFVEGKQFWDIQTKGPFAMWRHLHQFETHEEESILRDRIEYSLRGGPLGSLLAGGRVRRELERLFRFRHRRLRRDLLRHRKYAGERRLRIAITGASGLIGGSLAPFLASGGHEVHRLVRREPRAGENEIRWEPAQGFLPSDVMEGFDVVVHLAGENIASGRWTPERKRAILESRTQSTSLLSATLAGLEDPPNTLLCASAVGYYDQTAPEPRTEESGKGSGFLAEVAEAWEAATEPAQRAGIRVVNVRMGAVLSPVGGALGKMLLPFKMGFGGVLGDGRQGFSWIGIDDLLGVFLYLMFREELAGPVNATAPYPATNAEFTRTLGTVLKRPTWARIPAVVVRGLFGEMGEVMLLQGSSVVPAKLLENGFEFLEPRLEGALQWELGIPPQDTAGPTGKRVLCGFL